MTEKTERLCAHLRAVDSQVLKSGTLAPIADELQYLDEKNEELRKAIKGLLALHMQHSHRQEHIFARQALSRGR